MLKKSLKARLSTNKRRLFYCHRYRDVPGSVRRYVVKGRFFSRHRYVHAPEQFKLKHLKDKGIQQQIFGVQYRHENWFKQGYKQGP